MAEIRHLAAAVIPEPAEMIKRAIRIIRAFRRRPEHHIPIEFGRRIAVGRVADARIDVAKEIALHADDLADPAIAEKILGLVIMRSRPLLRADLYDTLRAFRDFL